MPVEATLVSAFLVGLLGSTHCLGMCGGIVGALTLGVDRAKTRSWWSLAPYMVAYNLGRVASYATAGALLGLLGARLFGVVPAPAAQLAARLLSGGFMIALGLYLSGWWLGLGVLERAGAKLWQRIQPWGRRLLPVRHPGQALLLGLLWGWLPCGLVYSALAWSFVAGSPLNGALLMAAFGAGTWPMLLLSGSLARSLAGFVQGAWTRRAAGMTVLAFGIYTLALSGPGHSHMHEQATLPQGAAAAPMHSHPQR